MSTALLTACDSASSKGVENDDVTSSDLTSNDVTSNNHWAGQWRLVNIWAEWCKPCWKEIPELNSKGTRVRFIGRRDRFPNSLQQQMQAAEQLTHNNTDGTLVIAADYGGQWDISQAAAKLLLEVKQGKLTEIDITQEQLAKHISLADVPAPDLLIRTGGERRVSNFLLWQIAYSELYFTDTYWPDFSKQELLADDVQLFSSGSQHCECHVAITSSELQLLQATPKLLSGYLAKKLTKVLNLIADREGLEKI